MDMRILASMSFNTSPIFIWKNAFKSHTIISGFEDCGIYPFDADLVTNQLRECCDPIPDLQDLPE